MYTRVSTLAVIVRARWNDQDRQDFIYLSYISLIYLHQKLTRVRGSRGLMVAAMVSLIVLS